MLDVWVRHMCHRDDRVVIWRKTDRQTRFEVMALEHFEEEFIDYLPGRQITQMVWLHAHVQRGTRTENIFLSIAFKYFFKLLLSLRVHSKKYSLTAFVLIIFNKLFWVNINLVKRNIENMDKFRAFLNSRCQKLEDHVYALSLSLSKPVLAHWWFQAHVWIVLKIHAFVLQFLNNGGKHMHCRSSNWFG